MATGSSPDREFSEARESQTRRAAPSEGVDPCHAMIRTRTDSRPRRWAEAEARGPAGPGGAPGDPANRGEPRGSSAPRGDAHQRAAHQHRRILLVHGGRRRPRVWIVDHLERDERGAAGVSALFDNINFVDVGGDGGAVGLDDDDRDPAGVPELRGDWSKAEGRSGPEWADHLAVSPHNWRQARSS